MYAISEKSLLKILVITALLLLVGCSREKPSPDAFEIPAIHAALVTKEEIDGHRVTLCSMNKNIDDAITRAVDSTPYSGLEPSDMAVFSPPTMIDNLIETTRNLHVTAREIISQKDDYVRTLRSFEEPLRRAPAELRQAAELFKQFSEEEEYENLRSDYIAMSEVLGALADRYELLQEQFAQGTMEKEYLEMIAYLEREALMLERFEVTLEIVEPSIRLSEAILYIEKLRAYIRSVEDFRSKLRRINDTLDGSDLDESEHHDTGNQGNVPATDGRTA